MIIGIPVYQDVDLLDVTGPKEIFGWIPKELRHRRDDSCSPTRPTSNGITSRDGLTFKADKTFRIPVPSSTCSGCRAARRRR